jgi:hypothetical protein
MIVQVQNYRRAVNINHVDASVYDGDDEGAGSMEALPAETLDLCGLSDAMMDDLRDMLIY